MCLPQRAFQRSRSAIKNCLIFVHVISSSISVRGQYKKETIIFIQKLIRIFTRIFFFYYLEVKTSATIMKTAAHFSEKHSFKTS